MDEPTEIELKLETDAESLAAIPMLAELSARTEHLVSTYFDTPNQDLAEAGYTLRIRRQDDRHIQTVKASGSAAAGLFIRPEWERDVDGDTPQLDPASSPLPQVMPAELLGAVTPLFTTDIARTSCTVTIGEAVIEVAMDVGSVRLRDLSTPIRELELELKAGDPRALFDLARRIDEQAPVRLGMLSKSERGYALATDAPAASVKAEPVHLDPEGDARDAFATIAEACIRQFRLNEALLMETGAPEPLHQARVGLRRLRSAFSLFKALFEGDDRAALLRAELKWLAAELGEVRDLDVLVKGFDGDVRAQLEAARAQAWEHVRVTLASARTRLMMLDLVEWLMLGSWRLAPADAERAASPIPLFAGQVLDAHRKRLKRRGAHLAKLDDTHRHEVRIEAKKLRYAAEFLGSLYTKGKKGRRRHKAFIDAVTDLQDYLGELNDQAHGSDLLARLGIVADLPERGIKRPKLLGKAEDAYEALFDVKRFWR